MSSPPHRIAGSGIVNPADLIQTELAAVEQTLIANAASEVELLEAAARHILEAGGKRLRPQLVVLCARALRYEGERVIPVAAAMELVHTATLVHDDIVDESDSRRGRASVNYFWGNSASVLIGDYLVVQAFSLVARDGDPRLFRLLCDAIARMCEGEVLQICFRGDTDISVEAYLTVCEYKTAALTQCCTRSGALLGSDGSPQVEALTRYGHEIGMAFQIVDDILDITGNERTLGKPVGGDLREGKVTLPMIIGLERACERDRKHLEGLFQSAHRLTGEDIAEARALIERYDGFGDARLHASRHITEAKSALATLPATAARDALAAVAERILDRDR
jgi:octaprenyl-diphosphate synthase